MTAGPGRGSDTSRAVGSTKRAGDDVVGEARWPMAGAVLAAIVLTILLPDAMRLGPKWLLPLIEGVLLVAVVAGDPVKINRRSRGCPRSRSYSYRCSCWARCGRRCS